MKRKRYFILMVVLVAVGTLAVWRFAFARSPAPELDQSIDLNRVRVELSFDYARQSGMASNQIAAWVTDKDGAVVKTLFATNFTAGHGGWEYRKESLPQWVAESGVAGMGKPQLDAISRATPASGSVRYAWYLDDSEARPVPAGLYAVNVEATLRRENRVLFQAAILVGGEDREERPPPVFFGSGTDERGMLTNVVIQYRK